MSRSLRELTAYVDNNYRARGNRVTVYEKTCRGCTIAVLLLVLCIGGCTALVVERWI